MVLIVSAVIGALGTVLSAAIALLGVQLKRSVDGQVTELKRRVELLELVLQAGDSARASE